VVLQTLIFVGTMIFCSQARSDKGKAEASDLKLNTKIRLYADEIVKVLELRLELIWQAGHWQ